MATGEKTAVSAISEFLETDVPWDELQNVSDADRDFFVAGIDFSLNFISIAE